MKLLKRSLQIVFYLLILALFVSRAASSGFSHDENQFIAPGQLLADHGLLPYIDYPYTHMPYGIAFYTVSAALSNYDFLAGRLFNAVLWALCSISLVWIIRLFSGIDLPPSSGLTSAHLFDPSVPQLLAEFVLVFIFLNDPIMRHIDGPALNHSLATLFGLLSLLLFGRLIQQPSSSAWVSFGSGAFASLAALTRLNYAALAIVLLILWAIRAFMVQAPRHASQFRAFIAGLIVAGIPALVLAASAPAHFFYGNFIYIRLNTIYYQQLLFRINMSLGSKLESFAGLLLQSPIDIILYAASLFFGATALIRFLRTRSLASLAGLALAGFASALALSAFAPTPTQPQYYFAPLPVMLIILGVLAARLELKNRLASLSASLVVLLALFISVKVPNPISEIAFLGNPSQWTPVQMHQFDERLKQYVPDGRFLSLLPMLPLEAGYNVYPFAATGSFSWRTSLLLTDDRRHQYGVTSPKELTQALEGDPPSGILTSLESTNDGFVRNDLGGLETPFVNYATAHGYKPVPLSAPFLRRIVTLWVRQP